jgi:microsomal epoxide hydrolase
MQPFRVQVTQSEIDDLKHRISATRWPAEPSEVGWERGIPIDHLRELADYWLNEYDWRTAEAEINQFPQYTTEIDGATIHFLHVRSAEPNATPVLLTHGWPGSFVEFLDVIRPLTDPEAYGGDAADAYHLVIPSLPGYGFSGPLSEPGWGNVRIAGAFAELMSRLGYSRYVVQGGDLGALVALTLAAVAPENVRAAHVSMLLTPPPDALDPTALTAEELAALERLSRFVTDETGYMKQQATRPQTLAYGLTDSPVGQLAWIAEKFAQWTDWEKVPGDAISRDRLLTNVSAYWFTRTAGSSAQLYYELADILPTSPSPSAPPPPLPTPLGVAVYPRDPSRPIRRDWAEPYFPNIIHWAGQPAGGHFAALEQPGLFAADLWEFSRKING